MWSVLVNTQHVRGTVCQSNIYLLGVLQTLTNGHYIADDVFYYPIYIFEFQWYFTENVPDYPLENRSVLVQMMAWRRWGDKPSFEAMLVKLTYIYIYIWIHICVTRPHWVNNTYNIKAGHCMFSWVFPVLAMRRECSGYTCSISRMLMSWFLASPSHQFLWYWLC